MSLSAKLEELELEARIKATFHKQTGHVQMPALANDINIKRNPATQKSTIAADAHSKPISGEKHTETKSGKTALPNGKYCTECKSVGKYCNCPKGERKNELRKLKWMQ